MKTRNKSPEVNDSDDSAEVSALNARGMQVFSDVEDFRTWLNSAIPALNGQTPHALLGTKQGRQQVLDLLVRIEHGLYS